MWVLDMGYNSIGSLAQEVESRNEKLSVLGSILGYFIIFFSVKVVGAQILLFFLQNQTHELA